MMMHPDFLRAARTNLLNDLNALAQSHKANPDVLTEDEYQDLRAGLLKDLKEVSYTSGTGKK